MVYIWVNMETSDLLGLNYIILYLSFYDSCISKMIGLEYFTIIAKDLKKGKFPAL